MAHSASALKRHRQSLRQHERNRARTTAARTAVRRRLGLGHREAHSPLYDVERWLT